ncbi:MAG: phage major capsid protein [Desulfobulbaceae bacterium]|nr:phage major capsid protein [Desulfobulbaceae bacterium]
MKKSDELKQRLATLEAENNELVSKESRSVEENATVDQYIADREALEAEIDREVKLEKVRLLVAARNGKTISNEDAKELKNYSFAKAIRETIAGNLTGLEKEMHEEALRENPGVEGIGVPSIIINPRAALGAASSPVISTDTTGFIDALRAKLVLAGAGAQFLSGLKGNISIPKKTTAGSATWEGEVDASADAGMVLGSVTMSPKRLSAFQTLSKQLLVQSAYNVEQILRNDLITAIQIGVDSAGINGAGSATVPTGILNYSGIGSVAGGTTGAAPTYANIINLEREVAVDDADIGALAFLTNPKVRAKLKATAVGTDQRMVWSDNGNNLLGYNAHVTTQVPSDLDKSTSTGVCSAIIFGNFNELIIGQWGGLDIVVDPYTAASNAQVKVYIHSFWDTLIRHAQSFAAMKDALTT